MTINISQFLTNTDHSSVDHTGLDGVPEIAILDNTATDVEINAALTTNTIVYLKPGTYLCSGQITIPNGKMLSGIGHVQDQTYGSGIATLQFSGHTGNLISLGQGSRIEQMGIVDSSTSSSHVIDCQTGGPQIVTIKGIAFDIQGARTGNVIQAQFTQVHLENLAMRLRGSACSGSAPIVRWSHSNGNNFMRMTAVARNISIECDNSSHTRNGIDGQGAIVENCRIIRAYNGIQMGGQYRPTTVSGCRIDDCSNHGIIDVGGFWFNCHGNKIRGCTGSGQPIVATNASAENVGSIYGNYGKACAGGGFTIGGGYINFNNLYEA